MNVTSMITRKSFLVLWSSMKNSRWTLLTLRIKFFIDKTNQKDDQENLKSVKNQEFEKSPKEIIRAKKGTKLWRKTRFNLLQSGSTYFKVDLEEFDLKSALFSHMNKKKPANKNTANYHLYHALMEALIADEDAMDKEVADKVKDHKRKHDSDDDEAMMMMRPFQLDQPGFRSKQRKEDLILPLLALTSTGWQITDTREAGVDSSMHKSDPESEHSEQSSDDISMQELMGKLRLEGH
ncbi:hypothetical protein Tco_0625321 [Tanacetum coccineum]|uniref:Uncharacterized protein n=1 Tax=Tanacetum coccineum TaxID=301880 RepID=A0ABQ4WGL4_9ASTR